MKAHITCNQCRSEFQGDSDVNRQCIYCHSFDLVLAPALVPPAPAPAQREILKAVPPTSTASPEVAPELAKKPGRLTLTEAMAELGSHKPENRAEQLLSLANSLATYLAHVSSERFKGKGVPKRIEDRFDRVTEKLETILNDPTEMKI